MRLPFFTLFLLFSFSCIIAQSCHPLPTAVADINQKINQVLTTAGVNPNTPDRGLASSAVHLALTQEMNRFWDSRFSSWATIGPRRLNWGKNGLGQVAHTQVQVHLGAVPARKDKIKVDVKELSGKGKTGYVICKVDRNGVYTKLKSGWFNEISSQKSNTSEARSHTLSGVKDHLISIRLEGKSIGSGFEYEVMVRQQ